MTFDIRHNEQQSRFEALVDGHVAFTAYDLEPGQITFTHTVVPGELGGRGIGNQLAQSALDHARKNNLSVVPACSFVAGYVRKHPEYEDLLSK